jgi:cytoskeletal protein CcmA (bactofilin family)
MWKRDEAVRPASGQSAAPQPAPPVTAGTPSPTPSASQKLESDIVNIGKSVVIKGELNGSEDLTIEGVVEGTIQLRDHVLTIGPNGRIQAQVFAKAVIVLGQVSGNIAATEKIDIRDNGSVDGDIVSPRVAIAEGAHFRGSVDMQRKGAQAPSASAQKPGAQPPQAQPPEPAVASGSAAAKPPAVAAQRVGA